jgi:hypothetical protein
MEFLQGISVRPKMSHARPGEIQLHSLPVKVHPEIGHGGREGEQRYSSILSLASALNGVGGQLHAPADLPPGKTWCLLYRRLGGPQGWSGQKRKIMPLTKIRSTDRPASNKSLYRLRCPGPRYLPVHSTKLTCFRFSLRLSTTQTST